MRDKFSKQLDELDSRIIYMGELCEQAIEAAVQVLLGVREEKIKEVIKCRDELDEASRLTEELCMRLLLRQQPVAKDMNTIANTLKLIRDMQRIGAQAVELAAIARDIKPEQMKCSKDIHSMSTSAIEMVSKAVEAFINKNSLLAQNVVKMDDKLDETYNTIKSDLSSQIFLTKEDTGQAIDILMIAKYLERIGDHTVNIARWINEIVQR